MATQFVINTLGVNLRSTPNSSNRQNIIAVLNMGHLVTDLDNTGLNGNWMHVQTEVSGVSTEGFVHSKNLAIAQNAPPFDIHPKLPAVHLKENNSQITRQGGSKAFPLGEPNRPSRDTSSTTKAKRTIHNIIKWLDVVKSTRFVPVPSSTFCNIYAYDFCYLAGAYLPRVWWSELALSDILNGKSAQTIYGKTVFEKNANSLLDWLKTFGPSFGWVRVLDPDLLQKEVNTGKVAVICAKRKDINFSGHITVVAPENTTKKALRNGGKVTLPLQSQAGAKNRQYFTDFGDGKAWWKNSKFQDFGFWVHE